MLRQDILNVIKKYVSVSEEQVSVQLDTQENCDVLELNITLPEDDDSKSSSTGTATRNSARKPVRNSGSLPSAGNNSSNPRKKSKSQSKVT
ncbi:UNVERIFIED_CONTAM: hypothetical protein GTU68_051817 [Idotea baltica]|nr:hypothetical protein [Idotea baltica]